MRFYLSLFVVKISNVLLRWLKLGSGNTWPGELALRIYPSLLSDTRLYPKLGFIFISGTNGKTTTALLLKHLLQKSGYKVVHNASGANLLNGIAATLCLHVGFLNHSNADWGIMEVDEFVLPKLLELIEPKVLLLLNLSRDQLDRYGETDIVLERWQNSIKKLSNTVLVYDATQPKFSNLSDFNKITGTDKAKAVFFDDSAEAYMQAVRQYGFSLYGKFNIKNLNASLTALKALEINKSQALSLLSDFKPAWGRGEQVKAYSKTFYLFLAKNPASFNNNLSMLKDIVHKDITSPVFLFVLNDNIPDGRDVSWIYDVSSTMLKDVCGDTSVYIAGTRAYDMAVRLFYAGVSLNASAVFTDLALCLKHISATEKAANIVAMPNYSAMLELRKNLTGRKIL